MTKDELINTKIFMTNQTIINRKRKEEMDRRVQHLFLSFIGD
jgi:hypothetical protein